MTDRTLLKTIGSGPNRKLSEFEAGDTAPVNQGGTGATTPAQARQNLGVPATSDIVDSHGDLNDLGQDDHPQYHNNQRGDARYYQKSELDSGQLDNRYFTQVEVDNRLALRQLLSEKNNANGYAGLDPNGKLIASQIPAIALPQVFIVADAAARIALVVQEGDEAKQLDDGSQWIYDGTTWHPRVGGTVLSTTDDLPEGASNLYFTLARIAAYLDRSGVSKDFPETVTSGFVSNDYLDFDFVAQHDAVYKITTSFLWAYNNTGRDFIANLLLDNGTDLFNQRQEPKDSSGNSALGSFSGTDQIHVASYTSLINLNAGSHNLKLQHGSSQNGIASTIYRADLMVERFI